MMKCKLYELLLEIVHSKHYIRIDKIISKDRLKTDWNNSLHNLFYEIVKNETNVPCREYS